MEKEAVQLVWSGVVVIHCSLVGGTPGTPTCYFLVPRNGYLGMHTTTVMNTFGAIVKKEIEEPQLWFSYESQPIPWHIPMGVILDRIAARKHIYDPLSLLPLTITAHFSNFPQDKICKFKDPAAVTAYYGHTIKSAISVMYGNHDQVYGRLSPRSYTQVTDCMSHNDPEGFVTTTVKLKNIAGRPLTKYPVSLHVDGVSSYLAVGAEEAQKLTLGGFLRTFVPSLYEALTDEEVKSNEMGQHMVYIQSTRPVLSTPFEWLCENLCCADHFLHVVVHKGPAQKELTV